MDFMLDIETLGNKPGAIVLSVGCVAFDRETGEDKANFYTGISVIDSRKHGLHIDPETMLWWFEQSPEAQRAALLDGRRYPLKRAVEEFKSWWVQNQTKDNCVWCQGLDFDVPIWSRAMAAANEGPPWSFWKVRDTRTVYDLAGLDHRDVPRTGIEHNALADARHQVRCLRMALERLSPEDDFLAA